MAYRPLIVFLTVLFALSMSVTEATGTRCIKYTTITGYFLQDEPGTDPRTFQYNTSNLGLIDRPYDTDEEYDPGLKKSQWQRFEHKVFRLNRQSGRHVQYKVLYLGRHGEGTHNVAEAFYGSPTWNCYWALQPGNASVNWTDARLTPKGVVEAQLAHAFWKGKIITDKIPVPETYYVSPLWRAVATADITFLGLELPDRRPYAPIVKELMREKIGRHTCDRRSSKSFIKANFPSVEFEPGFAELDPLWDGNLRETDSGQDARLRMLLDDIFSNDDGTFLSFTSHSGTTNSILRVIGHRDFGLVPGAIMPVLIKAEDVRGSPPSTTIAPPTPAPTCSTSPTPADL